MRYLVASIFTVILSVSAAGDTIHVPLDHTSIQGAIDASVDGDLILIAEGTYNEFNVDLSGRAVTIRGAVDVLGASLVTIDGQDNGTVVLCTSGESASTILEHINIANGLVSPAGAGMLIHNSSPILRNVSFIENTSAVGGAVEMLNSSAQLEQCKFEQNWGGFSGGALYIGQSSSPTLTDCVFEGNQSSTDSGGAVYSDDSSPTFNGCIFNDNSATDHGGGMYVTVSQVVLNQCVFSNNYGNLYGGGLRSESSAVTISGCQFENNRSQGGQGGGLYFDGGSLAMDNTNFVLNTALSYGAAMYVRSCTGSIADCQVANQVGGFAIFTAGSEVPLFERCDIEKNSGGGIWDIGPAQATYEDCRVVNNLSGGLFTNRSTRLINTVLCGNVGPQIRGYWIDGGGACVDFGCNDVDGDGVPDHCQSPTGDGVLHVPGEYNTIQEAIVDAGYGDTVLVGPGTWTVSGDDTAVIATGSKPITIRSSHGAAQTILDGEATFGVVNCVGGETAATIIEGFTITNGSSFHGAGVYAESSSPTVRHCNFVENHSVSQGGAMYILDGSPLIQDCSFKRNSTGFKSGGGIFTFLGDPTINGSTFCENQPNDIEGLFSSDVANEFLEDCPVICPADINGDLVVDLADFSELLIQFGQSGSGLSADINGDLTVDVQDFSQLLINYGNSCDAPARAAPAPAKQKRRGQVGRVLAG
ncbi:MAG: right-handed parallel beta-helix repeat-containing protein [Phycisphaerales bacterium]|nr:right-handed parallel beta-helix repeat-containing protein [Phycisphaerales bacterium]